MKKLILLLLLVALGPWAVQAQMAQNNTSTNVPRSLEFEDFESIQAYTDPEASGGYLPFSWSHTKKTGTDHSYWPKVCSHSCGNYQIPTNSTLSLGDRSLYMASSSSSEVGDTYAIWDGYGCLVSSVSFNSWRETNKGTLYFGYMTDPHDVSTFHSLQTVTPPVYTSATSSNATFTFSNLNIPYEAHPTFRWHQDSESTVRSAYLDNISITYTNPIFHIANTSSDTTMTWGEFASNVNGGTTYSGMTLYLDEDISTATMVGTSSNLFQGTFDGQGHTITFNRGTSSSRFNENYCAPFRYTGGATIKNLKVTGAIYTKKQFVGGIVARVTTNGIRLINCESNITINTSVDGDGSDGGLVGYISTYGSSNSSFEGCIFTGSLIGSNTNACGGFVGYSYASVSFNNCIFDPTAATLDFSNASCRTFIRYDSGASITYNKCYFTGAGLSQAHPQGKKLYTITGEYPVTVTINGTATDYDVSGITAYSDTPGLLYNGTVIASSGENVSLILGGAGDFYVDHGSLTGNTNPYLLGMQAYNTTISMTPYTYPDSLQFTALTLTTATLAWEEQGVESDLPFSWQICLNGDENDLITADSNPFTLTNLTPGATYTAKVRANYGNQQTVWSNETVFILPATLPYTTDFETECDWEFINGDCTNQWCWGTAADTGEGPHSIYISNDGGTSNASSYEYTRVFAAKAFYFEAGNHNFTFNVNVTGHHYYYYLRVALVPASVTLEPSNQEEYHFYVPNGGILIGLYYSWQTINKDITVPTSGYYKLVFAWCNDISNNPPNYYPAAIDNVSITPIAGPVPTDLQCTTVGVHSANLSWTENGTATAWQVCLNNDENNLIEADTNPFRLTGLSPETTYTAKVRAQYGNDGFSAWSNPMSFTTLAPSLTPINLQCTATTSTTADLSWIGTTEVESYTVKYKADRYIIPVFSEGFENGLGEWTLLNNNGHLNSVICHSGSVEFCFSRTTNPPQYLITPELTGVAEGMKVEFYYTNKSTTPVTFHIGFSATDKAIESFTFGDEITASGMQWHLYSATIPAGTKYICWKCFNNDLTVLHIDDIAVGTEVAAGEWQTAAVAGNYDELAATLTGLTPATPYEAFVYPDSSPENVSETVYFTTEGCVTPTNLTVSNVSTATADISWTGAEEVESYKVAYRPSIIGITEGFENGLNGWTPRDCSPDTGIRSNGNGHSGSSSCFWFSDDVDYPQQYLISPALPSVAEGKNVELYYNNVLGSYASTKFQVGFSTTDNATSSFTFNYEITATENEWLHYSVSVPAGTKYICLKFNSIDGWLSIDDIAVYTLPEWQTITSTTTNVTLTGLTHSTEYEARVISNCYGAEWSEPVYFTTAELTTVTQTTDLTEGWNWFSTYIEMDDPTDLLLMLEESLEENGVQIKNADYYTAYEDEEWFGDLDDEGLFNEQMYKILVIDDCTVVLEGMKANPANHGIDIEEGWNWIGFPVSVETAIEDAFADFEAEEGDVIKNSEDYTSFEDGEWFGDIEEMEPGQGYMYFSNDTDSKILIYRSAAKMKNN